MGIPSVFKLDSVNIKRGSTNKFEYLIIIGPKGGKLLIDEHNIRKILSDPRNRAYNINMIMNYSFKHKLYRETTETAKEAAKRLGMKHIIGNKGKTEYYRILARLKFSDLLSEVDNR